MSHALFSSAVLAIVLTASASGAPALRGQNFFSNCYFSHLASDDPIRFRHQPGASHSHTFFGNVSTNAHSSLTSLRSAATTCRRSADTAGYWIPTLYAAGRPVLPSKTTAYYVLKARQDVRPFPAGLKMIAGDAGASTPQDLDVVYWTCTNTPRRSAQPRSCTAAAAGRNRLGRRPGKPLIQLNVLFPDCWDGRRLDSADHKSHLTYSRDFRCPASHPVKVPRLRLIIVYPNQTGQLTLASGGRYSGHADFFNAWQQEEFTRLVAACSNYRTHAERLRCDRKAS
jgi:hypothetical protein